MAEPGGDASADAGAETGRNRSGPEHPAKLALPALTAIVVGSMVGAGVFQLPAEFAAETGVTGAAIAWAVAGAGMLSLALVFQALAVRKPTLDNGVFVYAREGFGRYPGFLSAVGYWGSACAGNAFYWVLILTTVAQLFPELEPLLGEGDTWFSLAVSVVAVWAVYFLIRRGVREAAFVNAIVTVAKLVPLALFLVLVVFALDWDVFAANLSGGAGEAGGAPLFEQVRGTMLATVFVFLGVEGASVYSRHAKRRKDVGRATVLGFLSVLALFASVSILSYGILPQAELAAAPQPSAAVVLEAAVGEWGGAVIRIGLIVAVLGAYLAWQLLAADVVYAVARDGDLPRSFAKVNDRDVPDAAVFWTSVVITVILFVSRFATNVFDFTFNLTASLALLPYLLVGGYALKIAITRDGYAGEAARFRPRDLVIAAIATVYALWLVWAAGLVYLVVACLLLAPATVLYVLARREQGSRAFTGSGLVVFVVVLALAVLGVVLLSTGVLRI